MRILCICGTVVVARHVQLDLRNTCIEEGSLTLCSAYIYIYIHKRLLKQFMAVMQFIYIEIVWQHLQSICIKGKEEREIRNIALGKGFDCK